MAEKANLKIADQAAITEDDPFAELTRIMGFDPRQPVRPAPAAAKPVEAQPAEVKPAEAQIEEPDFGIDLERELMGELAADEAPAAAYSAPAVDAGPEQVDAGPEQAEGHMPEPVDAMIEELAPQAMETAQQPDEQHGFYPAEDAPSDQAEETAPAAVVADEVHAQASQQDETSVVEVADAVEQGAEAVEQPSAEDPSLAEAETAASVPELHAEAEEIAAELTPELAAEVGDDASQAVAAGEAEAVEAAAAETAAAEMAAEPQDGHVAQMDAAEEQTVAHTQPPEGSDWEFDQHFDVAFAEHSEQPAGEYPEPAAASSEEQVDAQSPADEDSTDVSAATEDDIDAVADEAAYRVPLRASFQPQPYDVRMDQAQTEPGVSAASLEMSLEEELNALLGNEPSFAAEDNASTQRGYAEAAQDAAAYGQQQWHETSMSTHDDRGAASVEAEWLEPVDVAAACRQDQVPGSVATSREATVDDELDGLFDDQAFDAAISDAVAQAGDDTDRGEPAAARTWGPEEAMPRDGHDPYAALAALSADLQATRSWEPQPALDRPAPAARPAAGRPEAPEIETIEVPEQAVALADDLDLPEIAYEDEPAPVRPYDDLDAEFSNLLHGMNAGAAQPAQAARPQEHDRRDIRIEQPAGIGYFDDPAVPAVAGAAVAGAMAARAAAAADYGYVYSDAPRAAAPATAGSAQQQNGMADMEFAYDPDLDEEIAGPAYTQLAERPSRRRGLVIAAVVGGVALLGGAAAFALSYGGGSGSDEVALVKADPSPVKVKPENPGGTTIPNQDSKVYDSVAGAGAPAEPTQEKLLNSAEEPIEMPMPEDEPVDMAMADDEAANGEPAAVSGAQADAPAAQPMPKGTDRIEQVIQDPGVDESVEVAAVAPRKVRTMIVKADGTLVAREEPAAAPALDSASEGIKDPVASSAAPLGEDAEITATVPGAPQPAAAAEPQPQPAGLAQQPPAAAQAAAPQPRTTGTTPDRVPVAPARPSDQPVDIVGEVKAERVAALDPAAAAAPGSWSMQIASQPTEAAAQSSYQDLLRRYGGVLEGRQATIVKAEIAGKGTFWRVRVPAGSRNDAVKLCESYKSAGGSCFVSR